jgi:hypothetical protein
MSFSVPENPVLEGIISFLASRPHSWKKWRIDSLRTFDSHIQLQSQELVLAIEQEGREIRIRHDGLNLSPSKMVHDALEQGTRSAESPSWLKSGLKKPWKRMNAGEFSSPENVAGLAILEKRQFSTPHSTDLFIKFQ